MPHQYLDRTEGDTDELPPRFSVGLLSKIHRASWFCRFARGKNLLDRWGQKTAAELIARFQETVDNPYFKFRDMNDETPVNISADVLQVNGAKSGNQPLTRSTNVIVGSVTRRPIQSETPEPKDIDFVPPVRGRGSAHL